MRADAVPAGSDGLWVVRKLNRPHRATIEHCGKHKVVDAESFTLLSCYTTATLMKGGDTVMHDTREELVTHLDFALRASGRVLITGLGLGCVARGALANPAVTRVFVVERDKSVLRLVGPWMPRDPRLTIIHADALTFCRRTHEQFDCAWHDLWTNEDRGEGELSKVHADILKAMGKRVRFQGAWNFPRVVRKLLQRDGVAIL
jgi:hypothetical protein